MESGTTRQRFFREGRLAARVNHPNSVYVYGAEEVDGLPVITMLRIHGASCQCPCSGDHIFPAGAGPGGGENSLDGDSAGVPATLCQ